MSVVAEAMKITSLGEPVFQNPGHYMVPEGIIIPTDIQWIGGQIPHSLKFYERAGPREKIFFESSQVRAGIVTCGGLCPGLNAVIRSTFLQLHHGYGVEEVFGFFGGYGGLDPESERPPVKLTTEMVDSIHRQGGTILGTSRGPVNVERAVDNLIARKINMLFCVGGDGTMRGALELYQEGKRRGYALAVVGIPKTIDNDIKYIARSFGFLTAIDEAQDVIDCAHTEAKSVHNGISIVKLMGRHAGFIAAGATVASQDVNFCLIPEVPLILGGERGFLAALKDRIVTRQHAVIVVAEGAGQDLFQHADGDRDASGNLKLQDIGQLLRDEITTYLKKERVEAVLRYFDPSYQIRSCPPNCEDSILCDRFARNGVHAAMAGKTGLVIAYNFEHFVHVPMEAVAGHKKHINTEGELWQAVLATTGQQPWWS